jgi:LysR family nitrogen assimilation transcriptional regulator
LEERLAMPEEGETVRNAVSRTAKELGLELRVDYEVRSVAAMKEMVKRGAAASILPYFSVIDEIRKGDLAARPITMPAVRRTLFLACSSQRAPFRSEAGFTGAIRASLEEVIDVLGPLAHPLWVRTA